MLESITWKEYLGCIAIAVIIYYSFIGLLYRQNITKFFRRKESNSDSPVSELEGIVTEIRHRVLERAGKGATKQELITQLTGRLANYSGLREPALRYALNNNIIEGAKELCGVSFSEQELNEVWDGLPR